MTDLIVPPRDRDHTDSLWTLYSRAHQRAIGSPSIDNMRAAIEAYDRWQSAFNTEAPL